MTATDHELAVDPLRTVRRRRSAKWRSCPSDVVPLTLAEMDYALAPAAVRRRLPTEVRWRVGHLGVIASIAAFMDGRDWLDDLLRTLKRRREHLSAHVAAHLPGVTWAPPQATYLAWLNCTEIGGGDHAHALFLRNAGVAVDPGSKFGLGGAGHIRLNFATSATVLETALTKMGGALTADLPPDCN